MYKDRLELISEMYIVNICKRRRLRSLGSGRYQTWKININQGKAKEFFSNMFTIYQTCSKFVDKNWSGHLLQLKLKQCPLLKLETFTVSLFHKQREEYETIGAYHCHLIPPVDLIFRWHPPIKFTWQIYICGISYQKFIEPGENGRGPLSFSNCWWAPQALFPISILHHPHNLWSKSQ